MPVKIRLAHIVTAGLAPESRHTFLDDDWDHDEYRVGASQSLFSRAPFKIRLESFGLSGRSDLEFSRDRSISELPIRKSKFSAFQRFT
jgi:hypothetical protein